MNKILLKMSLRHFLRHCPNLKTKYRQSFDLVFQRRSPVPETIQILTWHLDLKVCMVHLIWVCRLLSQAIRPIVYSLLSNQPVNNFCWAIENRTWVELPKLKVWQNNEEQTKNKYSANQHLYYKMTAGDALSVFCPHLILYDHILEMG